ncbi:MAG: membrane protein insertion efficiency factor YidD [Armatimonadetes bacterium]|nr:membrane protein insertion efficiency factor YidD [Armatimonadota bacterium]
MTMNLLRLPDRLMGKMAVGAIHLYQHFISHDYNGENHARCMYTPSCSHYAEEALGKEGLIGGVVDTFMRLNRCVPEVGTHRMAEFARALAQTPEDELTRTFRTTNETARENLKEGRQRLLQALELARSGAAGAQAAQHEVATFFHDQLHVSIEDHPGVRWQSPQFVIGTEPPPQDPVRPHRGAARTALNVASSLLGGALGAAVGVLGLGATKAIAGTVMGTMAGAGRTEQMNQWISQRYGSDSVVGLAPLERRTGKRGYAVHRWLSERSPGWLAAAAGVAVGLPSGLGLGFWEGAREGLRVGWHAGKVFGYSVADRGVQRLVDALSTAGSAAPPPLPAV